MNSLEKHKNQVMQLSTQLRAFTAAHKKVRITHGSTNSTRANELENVAFLDIGALDKVIEIHPNKKYALVEPNVPMDELVEATLKHNLIPKVVMEFPGITVGGGIQGGAGESSSFKYGLFHDTCDEYEIILGDGSIVSASKKENTDLYWGTACSYGTLGVLTLAKVELIPAKKFVHLKYTRVLSATEINENLTKNAQTHLDFLDGILFTENKGVVIEGIFSDKKKLPTTRFLRAFDNWFYIHVDNKMQRAKIYEELVPIRDYLFRYDRGAFWTGKYTMARYNMPFNRLIRFLFNPFFKTRRMYKMLHATGLSQQYIVQDVSIPTENITSFTSYLEEKLDIYPLWFCPLKTGTQDKLSPSQIQTKLVMNIGIWGGECRDFNQFKLRNKELEQAVAEAGGRKVLYAHTYYSEEAFWNIYDKEWYEKLRTKYKATATFPDIYSKVHVSIKYVVGVRRGLKNYLLESLKQQ